MLTGRVPFDGESPVSIALKHVSEAPVPPSQINPEIPSALEQVVLWALNKDPADRPADADQFIMALEQVRDALAGAAGRGHGQHARAGGRRRAGPGRRATRTPSVMPAEAAGAHTAAPSAWPTTATSSIAMTTTTATTGAAPDLAVDRGPAGAAADRRRRRRLPADAAQEGARCRTSSTCSCPRRRPQSRTQASRRT